METETKGKLLFFPTTFGIDQEIKENPNCRPQFSNQHFPHLSSSIPNHNNTLIKIEKSIPSISFSDSGPIAMGEEPTRVARSVAAACLLNHFAETEPVFIPIVSGVMVAYLNRCHLLSPSEKEALLKAAGDNPDDSNEKKMLSAMPFEEEDSEEIKEKMISAIGKALLSIEKDTGAVTCFLAPNLDGCGKNWVYALSIRPDTLVKELLPISLRFRDLTNSPTEITDVEEYERQQEEKIRLLNPQKNFACLKCPAKYITKPSTTPKRRIRDEVH